MVLEGGHAVLHAWNEQIAFALPKMYRSERRLCEKIEIVVLYLRKVFGNFWTKGLHFLAVQL